MLGKALSFVFVFYKLKSLAFLVCFCIFSKVKEIRERESWEI